MVIIFQRTSPQPCEMEWRFDLGQQMHMWWDQSQLLVVQVRFFNHWLGIDLFDWAHSMEGIHHRKLTLQPKSLFSFLNSILQANMEQWKNLDTKVYWVCTSMLMQAYKKPSVHTTRPPAACFAELGNSLARYFSRGYHRSELYCCCSESHPGTVAASHLLVKHKESRRPSSWKARAPSTRLFWPWKLDCWMLHCKYSVSMWQWICAFQEPVVTRTKEEAHQMIQVTLSSFLLLRVLPNSVYEIRWLWNSFLI